MDDLMAGLRLAEPPGRNVRQRKCSAQQRWRQRWQKTEQRPGFDEARAERVGDYDSTVAHRLHQARHAETRAHVELERIREVGIESPQEYLDAAQPRDRADEDPVLAHG